MHILSLITSLITFALPQPIPPTYTPISTNSHNNLKSFRPIHAHLTRPDTYQLLWHNSTPTQSFLSPLSDDADGVDLTIRTRTITIRRPLSPIRTPGRLAYTLANPYDTSSSSSQWEDTEVVAPDVTDRETLRTLAKMTSNAYVIPDGTEWYPLEDWNAVSVLGLGGLGIGVIDIDVCWGIIHGGNNRQCPLVGRKTRMG